MLKCYRGVGSFARPDVVRGFWSRPDAHFEVSHTLGWEIPNRDNALIECGMSERAIGLTGFTGCALWIEPELDLAMIMMSNRIHPSRSNRKIVAFRQELFRTVLAAVRH
jgi:CubicO group peptidase (beta-lactamase class C family)